MKMACNLYKPQYEIRVSKALNAMGIKAYCPTYKKLIQYSDQKESRKLLMLLQVLVHIDEKIWNQVFIVPGVVRYVFWLGKPAVSVKSKEIETLKNSLSGNNRSFHFKI